jgi:RNA polymerase sigma-54 factor
MSAVFPRLELRQGQSLVMTQQLQQSIKLLQLSSQELAEYIDQELEKNPLLTMEEEGGQEAAKTDTPEGEDGAAVTEAVAEIQDTPSAVDDSEHPATEEWQVDDDGNSDSMYEPRTHARINDEYEDSNDSSAVSKVSLRDHLIAQLAVAESDPVIRIIGQHLIDLVDESGYIKEDLMQVNEQLGCDDALLKKTFALLHSFDPPGVCARTLKECLSIQLQDKDRLDPAMAALLEHLDLVASGNLAQLSKLCAVDVDDIKEMCAEIRALNPRPGIPDVILRKMRDRWQVELNPSALPRVLVNRTYHAKLLAAKSLDKQERKYVTDQLNTANWLVKALDQRAHTILKVSTEIVAQQEAFFRDGIKALRPITLKDVAAATGLHESTVSRVTSSKFMATPRGTFELKYFFNASLQNSYGGEGFSNKTVQHYIKELIDAENPSAPLSDDSIAEKLKDRGIEVARRTVAKYREIINIPSSSQRRRKN